MNRKQVLSSVTIAAVAGILLAWAPGAAYAGIESNAAVVVQEGCQFPIVENGGFLTADDSQFVSNKKTANISCHTYGVPNTTGAAYSFTFGAAEGCIAGLAHGIAVGTCTVTVSYDADTETGDAHLRANHMAYL